MLLIPLLFTEHCCQQLAEENRTLQGRTTSLREMVRRLEGELKSSTTTLAASEAETNKYKSKVVQLQVTCSHMYLVKMIVIALAYN